MVFRNALFVFEQGIRVSVGCPLPKNGTDLQVVGKSVM
jgi:hypothetical protein